MQSLHPLDLTDLLQAIAAVLDIARHIASLVRWRSLRDRSE
ncbi:hypothetical protein [Streptomyces malaysiensis]|nr:hypothetical protein [Streptomyces samsunensis]